VTPRPVRFETPVTLAGAGPLSAARLATALAHAPALVAADGAADALARLGHRPDLVVGDLDSLADPGAWRASGTPLLHLPEQETTDFEKCLYATEAPWYLGIGFTGGRVDHMLAVLHAMLARPEKRVILLGEGEVITLLPPGRAVRLQATRGMRVSLFPLAETTGTVSEGLEWPLAGLTLSPGRQIGTSNRATGTHVAIGFDRPGALAMLEAAALPALIAALAA
jgi:thiamine pyrophosphokinase